MRIIKELFYDLKEELESAILAGYPESELDDVIKNKFEDYEYEFYLKNKESILDAIYTEMLANADLSPNDTKIRESKDEILMPRLFEGVEDDDMEEGDELADYENEVAKIISERFDDVDADNLGDILYDFMGIIKSCMQKDILPSSCVDKLMSMPAFMHNFRNPEYDEDDDMEEGDELADYERIVTSMISAKLEDEGMDIESHDLSDALYSKMSFIRKCMNDEMDPMDCATEILNDKKFINYLHGGIGIDESEIMMPSLSEGCNCGKKKPIKIVRRPNK